MSEVTVTPFKPEDRQPLEQLLREAELPVSDLTPELLNGFVIAHAKGGVLGAAGVECYGEVGLLRSVVVAAAQRGAGLGGRLVETAEAHAVQRGVRTLYLLTTTAAEFFEAHGYSAVPRELAPAAIRVTSEFSQLCPVSSVFMSKPFR